MRERSQKETAERTQIGEVALIKHPSPLYRSQNLKTYERRFEEE